jgi:hypothetical protein
MAVYLVWGLWTSPDVAIASRLLWARVKEALGYKVSSKKLEADLINVARTFAPPKSGEEGKGKRLG